MTEQRPPSITYEQFIHEVRRFNTADLVAAIAALDPKWSEVGSGPEQWVVMSPWGLAAIARESLLHGNVHRRSRPIGETDIRRLHALFASTYGRREDELRDSSLEIVTRHVHEQFPFQESDFEELTRTVAVLGSHAIGEAGATLASVDVDALLGAPIEAGVARRLFLLGKVSVPR